MSGIPLSPGMKFVSYGKSVRCSLGLFPQPSLLQATRINHETYTEVMISFFWLRNRIAIFKIHQIKKYSICIGNHMDSSAILGIARAIASAIYACCECNYSQMAREIHVIKY